MRVALLSREYPPEVYGGAGVHVEHLARELATLTDLEVHCFGDERPPEADRAVVAYRSWERLQGSGHVAALQAMSVDLAMAAELGGVDLVHTHTWYTALAGHLAHLLYGVPHVITVHSLEPLRPWKAEQLGGGYGVSMLCERVGVESADAVIAVSHAVAEDIVRCYPAVEPRRVTVIPNAVDAREFRRQPGTDLLRRAGIDPSLPTVVYVGRITRQKGIGYLLDAAPFLDPSAQLVLRAGPADTPEQESQFAAAVDELERRRGRVFWLRQPLPRAEVAQLLSQATVVCCPSVYEPFGLVNAEAMACEAPVVASAVGGIPEIVDDGVTGLLVPFKPSADDATEPEDPVGFSRDLAAAVNELLANPGLAEKMGRAGRQRVLRSFSWPVAARMTVALYGRVVASGGHPVR